MTRERTEGMIPIDHASLGDIEAKSGSGNPVGPRRIARRLGGSGNPEFSICTMVTDWPEYRQCLASYFSKGFDLETCEFIAVDNSHGNAADAYVSCNEFLQAAQGKYVILTHQDVLLIDSNIDDLRSKLRELDARDPKWAICGNAGFTSDGWPSLYISHPIRDLHVTGRPHPREVVSLDENFLVIKKEANLSLSFDLSGFHHYGADLCVIADVLGWKAFVIDFHLRHLSQGTVDQRYFTSLRAFEAKYRRAFRSRWIHLVTHHPAFLSGLPIPKRLSTAALKVAKALGFIPRNEVFFDDQLLARSESKHRKRVSV